MTDTEPVRRIGIMTGGGDCPGLNAVIRAATKTAILQHGMEVWGIEDGFLGLIEDRMHRLDMSSASNILTVGGTILGTSNKANAAHFRVGTDSRGEPVFQDVRDRVVANVRRRGLDGIVCVGGDGTMSGANGLIEKGLRFVGVPKTIDNDLMHTEVTFGFQTAVDVATDALDRIHTTASSHHRVMLVETMGRNAGWLTLHAGLASGADVILIPEIPFHLDVVCDFCVERSKRGKAFSILGHVQRGGTPCPYDRVLATQFGYAALELLVAGQWGRLVVVQRGRMCSVPISEVADRQRTIELDDPLIAAARAVGTCFGDRPDGT